MTKVCSTCGYTTQNGNEAVCPYCGGEMKMEKALARRLPRAAAPGGFHIPLRQIWLPVCLIAVLAALLLYAVFAPDKAREQMAGMANAVQQTMRQVQPAAEEGSGPDATQEEEPEQTATDPAGNEILPDTQLPGLSVQPEYVLAESARSIWTVATQSNNLNLRAGPGTDYDIVGKMPTGTQVLACGYSTGGPSNWIVVDYQGTYGWACTDYLQSNG